VSRINPQGQYQLESSRGRFIIERREALGLVDGINSQLSGLAADQANRARECMHPYIAQVLALAREYRIERRLDIFDIEVKLNSALNVGTCLRPAALSGYYAGDISQGDGTPTSEEATHNRLDAVEAEIQEKLHGLTGQRIRLNLSNRVNFFRFFPGKSVQYFTADGIDVTNSAVFALLAGNEQRIGSLGSSVGTAGALYRYYTLLSRLSDKALEIGSPRAQQFFAGAQQSQLCIISLYPDIVRRLQSQLATLSCRVQVPNLSRSPRPQEWDEFVESIRGCIRSGG